MAEQIIDGTGTKYTVKVDKDNHLQVKNFECSYISYRSINKGDVFILGMNFKQTAGGTDEYAGYITYNGSKKLVIQKITVASQEQTVTQGTIYLNSSTSGGVASTYNNMNTTSLLTLPVTIIHQNDGASALTTVTDGTPIFQFSLRNGGMYDVDMQDAFILRNGLPLHIKMKCTTNSSLVRFYIICYEID